MHFYCLPEACLSPVRYHLACVASRTGRIYTRWRHKRHAAVAPPPTSVHVPPETHQSGSTFCPCRSWLSDTFDWLKGKYNVKRRPCLCVILCCLFMIDFHLTALFITLRLDLTRFKAKGPWSSKVNVVCYWFGLTYTLFYYKVWAQPQSCE